MLLRSSLASVAMLTLTVSASAQLIPLYPFSQSVGAYVPLAGGTVLGTVTGSSGAASLDDVTFGVTLPFAFPYNGSTYTDVQIQSNGHVALGTLTTTTYVPLSTTTANAGYISACGRDLQGGFLLTGTRTTGSDMITGCSALGPIQVGDLITGTGIPTGTTVLAIVGTDIQMSATATSNSSAYVAAWGPWSEMRWDVQGVSPNQVFIAQWSNFKRYGTSTTTTQHTNLNFQIHLHENGDIQCIYGACDPGLTTYTTVHQVGLRGPTNNFANDVNNRANTKGVNDDWVLSNAGTANSSGMLFNNVAPANVIPNGLTYTWNMASGTIASTEIVGNGCGGQYNSFYELFGDAAIASAALQGNAVQFIPTANGYVGSWIPGGAALFVTPVAPAVLATGDDGNVVVTPSVALPTPYGAQTDLRVSGNAIIGFGSGTMTYPGSNSYTPTGPAMVNGALGGFYAWHDYAENENGDILSEEIGNVLYITFDNVDSWPNTLPNLSTLQFQLDLTSGIVTILWVTVDTDTTSTFGSGHLVGVSAPGTGGDPGSVTLASTPLVTIDPEIPALSMVAIDDPVQGAAPQNWNLQADNLPFGLGIELIGFSDPGILDMNLLGIGQAGCQLRANLDSLNAFVAGGSHPWFVTLPGGVPSAVGFELYTQVAVIDISFNLSLTLTTNGVKGLIGDL